MNIPLAPQAATAHPALAVDGGRPVRATPLPPWPHFARDEIEAVEAVLASGKANYWTGTECTSFEAEFAGYVGAKHAVALANGSVALELALHALNIGPGDDVVVPARSFMASASCVVLRGARPIFADVDATSGNLTADTVGAVLTPRTRAVIAVHLGGWPCDMDPLAELARERSFAVIEDCAQSHGATYGGRVTGSMGRIGAFSFCQDKIITTGGEGGMLVTDDEALWQRAWSYKDHGKTYDAYIDREKPHGVRSRWVHESFGTNWRMTEMQAAIGLRQLAKLPEWLASRRGHARLLAHELAATPGLAIRRHPDGHAFYKFYAFVDRGALAPDWNRQRIISAITAEGIPCAEGSCSEMYLEQAFVDAGLDPAAPLPVSRELGETSLMFMVHPTMKERDVLDTAAAIRKVMAAAAN